MGFQSSHDFHKIQTLWSNYEHTETRGNLVFSHYVTLFISMNIWNDLKQMPWSQISLNIVTLHYESSRAQRVLSCQAFFVDENTLFMIKSSMENQVWSSISLLLRKRNLPGNRGDFAGPLTKMATDLAREHSFNTRPVKISYFTWSYNPHFICTIMPYPHN